MTLRKSEIGVYVCMIAARSSLAMKKICLAVCWLVTELELPKIVTKKKNARNVEMLGRPDGRNGRTKKPPLLFIYNIYIFIAFLSFELLHCFLSHRSRRESAEVGPMISLA